MVLNGRLSALSLDDQRRSDEPTKPEIQPETPPRPSSPSLSRIYRYTPIPTLVLDASMTVVEVSNSHTALTGKPRDSLLHARISDVGPECIPAPNIPILYGALRAATSTRETQVVEHILVDGRIAHNLRVTPIYEESTLLYIVLEADKLTAEVINSQHAYLNETYKILVDTVRDYAIFMLDPHGHIATWNAGAGVLKGYKAEEIIGKHFSILYSPEDRASGKPHRALAVCLREGRIEDEGWRYRRDGSRFWANVLITPIYQFGQHVGFVKVTRDLTERKEAEARMITAFEESSRLKTDFLANISHEIRTPMNGMQIAMTMLADTGLSPEQIEHATIIQDSMSLLLQIVNDVLDYSKLSSGSFSLHADMLDVREVVGAVVRNCRSSLKDGVELTTVIGRDFPVRLRGDPLRYRQVLQNLVGNAVKFTEKGSIRVSISCATDENDPDSSVVRTEVADTGIGVPDSAINTLFTPFTRFANSTTRKYQGTGLGLSICKSLAELMEGTVGFAPNPNGHGSIFWFTAKMGGRSAATPTKLPSAPATPVPTELATEMRAIAPRKHVLLVEDNIVNHTVMLKLLHTLGFQRVDGAWNGAEAVRMIKQKPLSYDVVLMDVSMPIMDGITATGQIRDMGLVMPIIAITGNALKGDAETYIAKGMNDCIGKPVHRDQLLNVLWRWIGT
ncbi:sensor histidine kinase/response regulator Fos-1/TcsA [Aspergillus mulundensis]|uniref:histidine kinase n=1 Tax=Aspergillus mulundensis TaxID=1810919 RepID=A0A3D8QAP3_9EURO|nr:Two-component system protein A [Aspergillus mulundensis]RDW58922.1 Two-component system protein A [Aspergillus mulundensis]